jgi:hypothetical protein
LHLGIAALIQNLKGERYPIFTGDDGRSPGYALLERVIGIRLVIFLVREAHSDLSGSDHGAKVETTFRMAFKGGLSLFSRWGEEISVRSVHFDGYEHYQRHVDRTRIVNLIGAIPPSVTIPKAIVVDDRTSDHRRSNCQEYDDCQLLQLTDIFVGGFRTVLARATTEVHYEVCKPLAELSKRWLQGPARMKNSRWCNAFSIRQAYLSDGQWEFADITPTNEEKQPRLF